MILGGTVSLLIHRGFICEEDDLLGNAQSVITSVTLCTAVQANCKRIEIHRIRLSDSFFVQLAAWAKKVGSFDDFVEEDGGVLAGSAKSLAEEMITRQGFRHIS